MMFLVLFYQPLVLANTYYYNFVETIVLLCGILQERKVNTTCLTCHLMFRKADDGLIQSETCS
jgi:hypothetical protein